MAIWTQVEVQQAVQKVGEKAASDQKFRQLVLADAKEAIKQVMGKEVPENLTLKMIEADPAADMTFVLPPLQTDELSDQELDQVAGGKAECNNLQTCNFDNTSVSFGVGG